MKKRLLVFSVDAMVFEDLAYLRTKPNFKKYLEGGSVVERVRSIYPTVTYPNHVSMMTGCYADKTGVFSNYTFTTDSKEDRWQWFHDSVKVKDIFTAAKEQGYTTASIFWTCTGCHPDIDYLINEYWMPNKGDTLESSFADAGSSPEVIEIIKRHTDLLHPDYVKGGRKNFMVHPYDDEFLVACAADIIREFAPEVTFVHNGQIDGIRHTTGVFGEHVNAELDRVDKHIGQVCEALEDAGVLADTDIFLVSDHGQLEIKRTIKLNALLADHGLVDVNEKGKCADYRAYCLSNAMSSLVYLKDPNDKELYDRVYRLLCDLRDEGIYGFSQVFTREEIAEKEHLDGDFSFVLESDGYTSFSDSCKRPLVAQLDLTDFRFGRATHGYYPDLGPQPTLVAKGPSIKEGVVVDRRPIVDEAPTYAKLLGASLPDAQGSPIDEILK